MIPAPPTSTNANPAPWDARGALAAAERALAKPRPQRSSYSRGPFGEDCYELALADWQALQRKATCLHRLAERHLAAGVN